MTGRKLLQVAISLVALLSLTFSPLFAQDINLVSQTLTSANSNTVNINDVAGSKTITIDGSSRLSNSNASGKTVNYVGSAAGDLTINIATGGSLDSAESVNSRAIYVDNPNANVLLNNTGNVSAYASRSIPFLSVINGVVANTAIEIANANSFEVNFQNYGDTNFIVGDIVNRGSGLLKISSDANTALISDVFLGSNPNSSVSLTFAEMEGSINFGNAAQKLNVISGYFSGAINNQGVVTLSNDVSNPRSNGFLYLTSSTLSATINSASSTPAGHIYIANDQTVTLNADIGGIFPVKKLFVLQSTLDLSANNNVANVVEGINLVNKSNLKLGDRTSNSEIKLSNNSHNGSDVLVEVKGNNTLGGALNIGLGKIVVDANKTLSTAANNVTASSITLNSNSGLTIGSGVVAASIEASEDGVGTLTFAAPNNNLSLAVGSSSKKLSNVEVLTNGTLNLGTRTLNAYNVTLAQGAVLNVEQGAVSNNIVGATNGTGKVNFANNATLNGNLGGDLKALAEVDIAGGKSINLGANSANIKDLELATSAIMTSSSANTLNLTNAVGNYLVTIGDEAALTNTNANGNVINYSGSEAGSLTLTLNGDGANNQTKIQAQNNLAKAVYFNNANADLVINNNSAAINGGITIDAAKSAVIRTNGAFSNSGKINGDITNNSNAKLEIALSGNAAVSSKINLGTNADSKVEMSNLSGIVGSVVFGNSAQNISMDNNATILGSVEGAGSVTLKSSNAKLWLNSSTLSASVDGFGDVASGEIRIMNDQTVVANADIGATKALRQVYLQPDSILDLAANNKAISAGDVLLDSGSKIKLGNASVNSNISNSNLTNGSGVVVEIVGNNTLNGNVAIGLGKVSVAQNATLNLDDNQINAAEVVMNKNAVLNVQQGVINADITASERGVGSINFSYDGEFSRNIGSLLNPLANVSVASGKNVLLGNLTTINALNIAIGDNSSLTGRSDQLLGNISFEGSSRLSLDSGLINGEINGSADGNSGVLYINEGQTVTTTKDLGRTSYKLSLIELGARSTLNLDVNNNSVGSNNLILNSEAVLNIGSGVVQSSITPSSNGVGVINIKENISLAGNVGSSNLSVAEINVAAGKIFSNGGYEINANKISLNSGSVLDFGYAAVNGLIVGSGEVNIGGENISNLTAGSDSQKISSLNVRTGAKLNLSNSTIHTDRVLVTYNSNLTLDSGANVYGDFYVSRVANLIVNDGANFVGSVKSLSDTDAHGTFTINASNHVVNYEIGDNNNFLNEVNFAQTSNTSIFSQINSRTTNIAGSANFANSQGNRINGDLNVLSGAVLNIFDQSHNVAGNLNVESGATIKLEINRDNQGSLTAAGLATVNANTNIHLTIDPTLLQEQAKSGLTYTIISGANGSDIGEISANNIALVNNSTIQNLKFSTIISNNSLILNVVQQEEQSALGKTDGQRNLYRELLNLDNANGNLLTLKQLLLNSQNRAFALGALEAANPQIDNSINRLSFENTTESLAITSKRINALRGISSGSALAGKSAWVQTFGAKIHQGNTAISNGYNATTQGLLFGFDQEIENDLILGTSFSYADSNIDSINNQKSTNLNTYQFNLYAAKDFSNYFINAMLGFAYNEYSSLRKISIFNMEARAKYSGQTYIAKIEAGSNFRMEDDYIVTPLFSITTAKNVIDNYQETGAEDLNLGIKNNSTSFFETRGGVNVSKALQLSRKQKIQPNFGISYGYDFAGSKQKTRATFVGQDAGFDAKSANIPQGSLRFEVGSKIFYMNSYSFDLVYSFDLRNNYYAHSGSVRAKYDF